MRRSLLVSPGLVAAAIALAGGASASPLGFSATLAIEVGQPGTPQGLAGSVTSSTSGVVDVALDGSFSLPASLFAASSPCTTAAPCPLLAAQKTGIGIVLELGFDVANAAGSFAPGAGGFGGDMPLPGTWTLIHLRGLGPQGGSLAFSFGFANLAQGGFGAITQLLRGERWTTGVVAIVGPQITPGPNPTFASSADVTRTGFDARTPGGLGTLQLVTPLVIEVSTTGVIPSFGILTLEFSAVPEPAPALLLLAPAAALTAFGRCRRRLR